MRGLDFKDYLLEYQAEGVGTLLYTLIASIVKQTVLRYPPNIYSPNQTWDDDAVAALCHDFTIEILLNRGWLEHHLLTQESTSGFRWVILRDFRHFLISRRKKTEYSNLFRRVQKILRTDARFKACQDNSKGSLQVYAITDSMGNDLAEGLGEIVEAMFSFKLPSLIRYRAGSSKHSHLLSNEDLANLLARTLEIVDKCVSIQLLMEALRYRLNLLDFVTTSLNEVVSDDNNLTRADFITETGDFVVEVTAQETAEDIFASLSTRQQLILAMRLLRADSTIENISAWTGVPKSTVHNQLKLIAEQISIASDDQDEGAAIVSHLTQLCEQHLKDLDPGTVE